jgi:hypothetical protein
VRRDGIYGKNGFENGRKGIWEGIIIRRRRVDNVRRNES